MSKNIIIIFFEILMIIFIPIMLILTNVQIISFNSNFYNREINKYNIESDAKMSYNDLKAVYNDIIEYLKGSKSNLQIKSIVNGKYRNVFDSTELKHMSDVKELYKNGFLLRNMAFILSLVSIIALILLKKQKKIYKTTLFILVLSIVIFFIMGFLLISDFNKYFNYFHSIFFSNKYWLLDPNKEVLINLCPIELFQDAVVFIIGLYFIEMLFIILLFRKVFK